LSPHSFEENNAAYFAHACVLSEQALRSALDKTGLDFPDIDHIISVTTTGLLTPSLEAHLAQCLPFPRDVKRTPLFGSGCAGGAVALARAADFLLGRPEETVLVLSVELCSLTFMPQELETTQIVADALFGDGASAAILAGDRYQGRARAEIVDSTSALLPGSLDIMGWDFTDQGMRLVLSPRATILVENSFAGIVEPFLARQGLKTGDIEHFLLHPGSAKILNACERSLGIDPEMTRRGPATLLRATTRQGLRQERVSVHDERGEREYSGRERSEICEIRGIHENVADHSRAIAGEEQRSEDPFRPREEEREKERSVRARKRHAPKEDDREEEERTNERREEHDRRILRVLRKKTGKTVHSRPPRSFYVHVRICDRQCVREERE
jgi:hypothetical protein